MKRFLQPLAAPRSLCRPTATSAAALSCTARCLSSAGASWISKFRYGFEGGPFFGSLTTSQSEDLHQKQLYCKALVYSSCGSRLARDWIAGCAALMVNSQDLVHIALQHDGTRDDVKRFMEGLQQRLAGNAKPSSNGSSSAARNGSSSAALDGATTTFVPTSLLSDSVTYALGGGSDATSVNVFSSANSAAAFEWRPLMPHEVETIQRCFIYDAIKAASFHEMKLDKDKLKHLQHVGRMLNLDETFVNDVRDVVEEENQLMKLKFQVLDQPLSD